MKKIAQLLFFCFVALPALAQDYQQRMGIASNDNFFQICAKADAYFSPQQSGPVAVQHPAPPFEDNEYRAYQRWKWYWQARVDENGNFPDLEALKAENDAARENQRSQMAGNWTNISQTLSTGGYNGMGRTTCIAFHPTNANTFFVGAPIGGLWKTTDGGQTWTALTDGLPYVSVGSCLVDPSNPNTIYISIGDHMGWWNRSLGIYKSTDGGVSWSPTG
ncbi:MAG: WD40/YVTN/BNR-like repeat-containing protein, partial [Bacteroidia bacterium]